MERIKLFNDHFQNYKVYVIPKAQLVLTDIPYNVGVNAYGSNPSWYIDGDNKNGESKLAGKNFFDTDERFKIPEFLHFCSKMLRPDPQGRPPAVKRHGAGNISRVQAAALGLLAAPKQQDEPIQAEAEVVDEQPAAAGPWPIMAARGLDKDGKWVGFDNADKFWSGK